MIESAYQIAKRVHNGLLTPKKAVDELFADKGVPPSSTKTLLHVYSRLRDGERFTRRLNTDHLAHFLQRIATDFGPDGVELALRSVNSHITYFEMERTGSKCTGYRLLVNAYSDLIGTKPIQIERIYEDFAGKVARALNDNVESRQARLAAAEKTPVRKRIVVLAFSRSADVVAEVLYQAKGICGKCAKKAPFCRNDGTPYLEVHHKTLLAAGGDDTVANAIALCPNCHRERHYGVTS